jgi:hypothetical protein
MKSLVAIGALLAAVVSTNAHADTFDKQERCAARAEAIVPQLAPQFAASADQALILRSHYNKKQDKCFVLFRIDTADRLFDAFSREQLALFLDDGGPTKVCYLDMPYSKSRECRTQADFDAWLKPYMTE